MLTCAISKGCSLLRYEVLFAGIYVWLWTFRKSLSLPTSTYYTKSGLEHLAPCEDGATSSFEPSSQSTRSHVFLISNAVIKPWISFFCFIGLITTYSRQKSKGVIKPRQQVPGRITDTFCPRYCALLPPGLCSAGCSSLERDVTGSLPCEVRTQIPQFCSQLDSKSKTMAGATEDMRGQGCCLLPLLHPFSH